MDDGTLLVHASPTEPLSEYLLGKKEVSQALRFLQAEGVSLCFCGHTHRQAFFYADIVDGRYKPCHIFFPPKPARVILNKKCHIINPGSVGDPRFLSTRTDKHNNPAYHPAHYALWLVEKKTILFKTVYYRR